ncbi:MAG: hypothetical protein AAB395_03165 [Patescibacteria group bacterium]
MAKNSNDYKVTMKKARAELNAYERLIGKFIHLAPVSLVIGILEKTLFRQTPMQFGLVASVTMGLFLVSMSYLYGYQISSLEVLVYIFGLGFIVGLVFEYVRSLLKQQVR